MSALPQSLCAVFLTMELFSQERLCLPGSQGPTHASVRKSQNSLPCREMPMSEAGFHQVLTLGCPKASVTLAKAVVLPVITVPLPLPRALAATMDMLCPRPRDCREPSACTSGHAVRSAQVQPRPGGQEPGKLQQKPKHPNSFQNTEPLPAGPPGWVPGWRLGSRRGGALRGEGPSSSLSGFPKTGFIQEGLSKQREEDQGQVNGGRHIKHAVEYPAHSKPLLSLCK